MRGGPSGTLAHRDVRARAYRDVFTAVPEGPSRSRAGSDAMRLFVYAVKTSMRL